jgi:hypothetical protein
MRIAVIPLFMTALLSVGCGESGACIEAISQGGVSYSWCKEVEHQSSCPVLESGEDGDEFRWEWNAGSGCKKLGYAFACGNDVFEDVESECRLAE